MDPSVTIFRRWLENMIEAVLADDVKHVNLTTGYGRYVNTPGTGSKLLINALLGEEAGVPQTTDFLNGEEPDAVVLRVFEDTVAELAAEQGADQEQWLTEVRGLAFSTRNFLGVPQAGEDEVLTLPAYMNRGTQNHQVRFADGDVEMCAVAPPGQSGFVSPQGEKDEHYRDQLNLYRDFECKTEWLTPEAVDSAKVSEIELTYKR